MKPNRTAMSLLVGYATNLITNRQCWNYRQRLRLSSVRPWPQHSHPVMQAELDRVLARYLIEEERARIRIKPLQSVQSLLTSWQDLAPRVSTVGLKRTIRLHLERWIRVDEEEIVIWRERIEGRGLISVVLISTRTNWLQRVVDMPIYRVEEG